MLAVPDRTRRPRYKLLLEALALRQRNPPQIETVYVKEIEGDVRQVRSVRRGERILQRLKAGPALRVHDDDFTIEPGRLDRQAGHRAHDRWERRGPVLAIPRHHVRLAVGNATQHAITVVLDFLHPGGSRGRRFHERRELRFD